ncbi:MAG: 2-oxoacid:acceptor oxidoreductase family protein [Coriobacteriales bacterium]|jgi:indolepyruvate ferredoxin oxidoreductase beta subunit|nr:2-oxoacid:acceptor oxidoreductase family protein [Coriobacteriales bacterium]
MPDIIVAGVGGQGTVLASKLIAHAALAQGSLVRTAETIGMAQRGGSVLGHVRITAQANHAAGAQAAGTAQAAALEARTTGTTGAAVPADTAADTTGRNPLGAPLSPLVPPGGANLLIGFEPAETLRALPYLRQGGTVVTAQHAIAPPTATLDGSDYNGNAQLAYLARCAQSERIGKLVTLDDESICQQCGTSRVLNVALLGAAVGAGALAFSAVELAFALEALVKPRFVALNKRALTLGMQEVLAANILEAYGTRIGEQP